jgi:large subunit ribosomal protein L20
MPRSSNSVASRKRRKKIIAKAKGFFLSLKNVYTVAKNAVEKRIPQPLDSAYQCRCEGRRPELLQIYRKINKIRYQFEP